MIPEPRSEHSSSQSTERTRHCAPLRTEQQTATGQDDATNEPRIDPHHAIRQERGRSTTGTTSNHSPGKLRILGLVGRRFVFLALSTQSRARIA